VGLGWSIAFVASNAELTSLTAPSERGGIIGLSDLISGITGATVTILGGILFAKAGLTPLGITGAILALLPIYSVFSKLRETKI
jgi:predicted MFS family arabinose efflux permease